MARRSLRQGPALSVLVKARGSLCRGPALSVSGPNALCVGPGALCVTLCVATPTHPARRFPFFQERTPNLPVWGISIYNIYVYICICIQYTHIGKGFHGFWCPGFDVRGNPPFEEGLMGRAVGALLHALAAEGAALTAAPPDLQILCIDLILAGYLSSCLRICLSICLSVYLSIYLSSPSVCLSIHPSIYLFLVYTYIWYPPKKPTSYMKIVCTYTYH